MNPMRKPDLLLPIVLAIALFGAAPARATMSFSIESVAVTSPSSGDAFEVFLTNTGSAVDINSFTFELSISDTHFNFTSVTTATVPDTYIFAGNSLFGPNIDFPPASGQSVTASDAWVVAGNGFTVGTGVTVGLGEVFFDVTSGAAPGPYTVSFAPSGTSLSDINGNAIPIDNLNSGTITVGGSAVPEPSTFALFGVALAAVLFARKRLLA
jgi:hypothetical protein